MTTKSRTYIHPSAFKHSVNYLPHTATKSDVIRKISREIAQGFRSYLGADVTVLLTPNGDLRVFVIRYKSEAEWMKSLNLSKIGIAANRPKLLDLAREFRKKLLADLLAANKEKIKNQKKRSDTIVLKESAGRNLMQTDHKDINAPTWTFTVLT